MWNRRPRSAVPVTDPRPDDRALVRRLRAGDEAAFNEFFEAHSQGLFRFVLARVDHDVELAKELTQAGICKGIEKIDTYRGEAPLFSWLCGVCRFEVTNYFRRVNRRPPEVELAETTPVARAALDSLSFELGDPEDQALRREVARLVHVTADHLPPLYREVLEKKYVEGLPVRAIAGHLGISPKAAESLLTRARQAFKDGYASLWGSSPALAVEGGPSGGAGGGGR